MKPTCADQGRLIFICTFFPIDFLREMKKNGNRRKKKKKKQCKKENIRHLTGLNLKGISNDDWNYRLKYVGFHGKESIFSSAFNLEFRTFLLLFYFSLIFFSCYCFSLLLIFLLESITIAAFLVNYFFFTQTPFISDWHFPKKESQCCMLGNGKEKGNYHYHRYRHHHYN